MNPLFPSYRGLLKYSCLGCQNTFNIDSLLYTCPKCGEVLLIEDKTFDSLKEKSGSEWRAIFDERAMFKDKTFRGIFRFYELMAPVLEPDDIVYLGEGNTPIIEGAPRLCEHIGQDFAYKNDGQNPSASFKDRGMACAYSFLQALVRTHGWDDVLTVCASTGDTSAAAALYASYIGGAIKSVVLLPKNKVTPQQLAQPLGSGATVLEVAGVFDDCMKIVEYLAEHYRVALLNSKNSWRILGQESYAFEVAQWYDWKTENICIFVPIGNAGNITAIMRGFLKLHRLGIIDTLPKIFGVQSHHADPVYRYYSTPKAQRHFAPVNVEPSVAQAAMIGNPVSFPRVRKLAEQYQQIAGEQAFDVIQVTEQEIMDGMLLANRHGAITCTQGGECFAGMLRAKAAGLVNSSEKCVLDATAHALKFMDFQNLYFEDAFPPAFGIKAKPELCNAPELLLSESERHAVGEQLYVLEAAKKIAKRLNLSPIDI